MSGDEMVVLIAQAMYESDREALGEEWPDWNHRNGLLGADYMNRAQAAVKALWGAVPPWMEHVPDGEGAWGYPRGLVVDGHVVYRVKSGGGDRKRPLTDIAAHPPRYMVRCSNCGIVAVEMSIREAADVEEQHRCLPIEGPR